MDPGLLDAARNAIGFMPEDEGVALFEAGLRATAVGPLLEIGSYCGKSAVYLGAAARAGDTLLYSIDHHRGSEEHQPGEGYFDERLVDGEGNVDTLVRFRDTIRGAGLEEVVVAIVGSSPAIAALWKTPLGLVFIDGGHSRAAATADYEGWAPHVAPGGSLAIHDVFADPAAGGRPPFETYQRATASGAFEEATACGSLRVLQRIGDGV
jgi:predicted O-methyltransferase YrrM